MEHGAGIVEAEISSRSQQIGNGVEKLQLLVVSTAVIAGIFKDTFPFLNPSPSVCILKVHNQAGNVLFDEETHDFKENCELPIFKVSRVHDTGQRLQGRFQRRNRREGE